jgi:adenylate cyclase
MAENQDLEKFLRDLTDGYHGPDEQSKRLDYLKHLIDAYKRYLPARVIEKIKVDPYSKRIDGERRNITVVFADLSGFTALSETMDAEDIAGVINEFFTRMVRIVHKYDGSVDKFLGDALMVLFGAPVTHYDDPERAIRASLEMQEEMNRFNRERNFASPLAMSIGVNTGPAVALNVGSEDRMEYTVIGDTVNLAARLEGVSKAGEIIISNFTYEHVADIVDVAKMPSVKVKGKRKPVINYLVRSVQEHRSVPVTVKTRLVGRREEIARLTDALKAVQKEQLLIVPLIGDPGSGKTRLGVESESLATAMGFTVLTARCMPYESGVPYRMIGGLLNALYGIKPGSSGEEKRIVVSLALKNKGFDLNDTLPYIGILTGFEYDRTKNEAPEEVKKKIFKTLKNVFQTEAEHNKVFVRIEDLQWSDPTSIEMMDYFLKEMRQDAPILFLFECRSDYAFPWLKTGNCRALVLGNLSRNETREFCQVALQGENIPEAVSTLVYEKSGGNPLFAAEVTRLLLKKGALRRAKDGYTATGRFKTIEIAESISSLILDQVDRMSELERRILQYASVIGKTFDRGLLTAILKIPGHELSPYLDKLQHFDGLLMHGAAEDAYEFSASTTYDVVYSSLLRKRRKELHLLIGNEIETSHSAHLNERLEELAIHYARSTDERKGIHYLKAAADKTYHLYALKETLAFFENALALLQKKGLSADEKKDMSEVLRRQGWVFKLSGRLQEALASQKKSLKLAREINSPRDEGMAANNIGIIYHELGVPRKGLAYWSRALLIGNKIGDPGLQTQAIINLGHLFLQSGDLAKALDHYTQALGLSRKTGRQEEVALGQMNIGNVYERMGDFARAVEFYRKAIAAFETIGEKGNIAKCLNMIGMAQMYSGNLDEALKRFEESAALSEKIGDAIIQSKALGNVGLVYVQMWQLGKARELFEQSLAIAQVTGEPQQIMAMKNNIGDVHLFQGKLNLAIQLHLEALELSVKIQDVINEGIIRRSMGWDYFNSASFKNSMNEFKKSHDIFMKINDRRNGIISMLGSYAVACHIGSDPDAVSFVRETMERAVEKNDPEIQMLALEILADQRMHEPGAEPTDVINLFDQLLQVSRSLSQKRLHAWTLSKKALFYLSNGLLSESGDAIAMSKPLSADLQDRGLSGFNALVETGIFMARKNPADALAALSPAAADLRAGNHRELLVIALRALHDIFTRIGDRNEALRNRSEAQKSFKGLGGELNKAQERSLDIRISRTVSWITGSKDF